MAVASMSWLKCLDTRHQREHPAHHEPHLDSGLAGFVELPDQARVLQIVDLEDDMGRPPLAGVLDLGVDEAS